jgi:hypothetical protein
MIPIADAKWMKWAEDQIPHPNGPSDPNPQPAGASTGSGFGGARKHRSKAANLSGEEVRAQLREPIRSSLLPSGVPAYMLQRK